MTTLLPSDLELIVQCLKAISHGPFVDDVEFHTVMGCDRQDVIFLLQDFNEHSLDDKKNRDIAHAAIVNLWGYPHGNTKELLDYTGKTPDELFEFFERIKKKLE